MTEDEIDAEAAATETDAETSQRRRRRLCQGCKLPKPPWIAFPTHFYCYECIKSKRKPKSNRSSLMCWFTLAIALCAIATIFALSIPCDYEFWGGIKVGLGAVCR